MQAIIEVKQLAIGYHQNALCQNINFGLQQGNVLCILGANGEGKTTLLKTLLGLQPPIKGAIYLNGKNMRSISLKQRADILSYVPQSAQSGFAFSVLQMITMGKAAKMGVFSQPAYEDHQQARAILAELNIPQLEQQDYSKLSGGQRQLVLIARALMQNAKIIILDEPTASLDFHNQAHLIALLAKLKQQGRTIIFTTHQPDQAFQIADEVLMIKDSTMLCHGATADVMSEDMLSALYSTPVGILEVEGRKMSYVKNSIY